MRAALVSLLALTACDPKPPDRNPPPVPGAAAQNFVTASDETTMVPNDNGTGPMNETMR